MPSSPKPWEFATNETAAVVGDLQLDAEGLLGQDDAHGGGRGVLAYVGQ